MQLGQELPCVSSNEEHQEVRYLAECYLPPSLELGSFPPPQQQPPLHSMIPISGRINSPGANRTSYVPQSNTIWLPWCLPDIFSCKCHFYKTHIPLQDAKGNCQVLPLSRPPAGHIVQRIDPWHIVSAYLFNLPYTKEYENIVSWQRLVVMHRVLAAAAKSIKNAVS